MSEEANQHNTIVPLYISSKDRAPGSTSSSNFKIKLRKNLKNIETLKVSAISIPSIITVINSGNNQFTFGYFTGSNDYNIQSDTLSLTVGNYDYNTLATELQTKLNASTVSTTNGLTWSVSYSAVTLLYSISIAKSVSGDWSIQIVYSNFTDVVGLGSANFNYGFFNTSVTSTTAMTIPCERRPNLIPLLSYNITSATLTNGLNTSFVKSLGALFNIYAGFNDKAILDIKKVVNTSSLPTIALGLGGYSNLDVGASMAVASNAVDSLGNSKLVLVVGAPNLALGTGSVVIFVTDTNNRPSGWTQNQDILIPANAVGLSRFGCSVDITDDGKTLVIAGRDDTQEFTGGAIWVYKLINSTMTYIQTEKIIRSTYAEFQGALFGSIGYTVSITDDAKYIFSGSYSFYPKIFTLQDNGNYLMTHQLNHSGLSSLTQLTASRYVVMSKDGLLAASSIPGHSFSRGGAALWYRNIATQTWNESTVVTSTSAGFSVSMGNIGMDISSTTAVGANSRQSAYLCLASTKNYVTIIQLDTTDLSNIIKVGEVAIQPATPINFSKAIFINQEGTKLIIGDDYETSTGVYTDAKVYVYERTSGTDNTWNEVSSVTWPALESPNNGTVKTGLGSSLTMVRGNDLWVIAGATEVDFEIGCVFDITPTDYKKLQPKEILGQGSVFISTSGQGRAIKSNKLNGNVLLSSGIEHKSNTGAVWVFENSTGIENSGTFSQVFTNTPFLEGTSPGDYFGYSIDIFDNVSEVYMCISAPGINTVYIYKYTPFTVDPATNTVLFQTITHPEISLQSIGITLYLGESVAFSGDSSILIISDSSLDKCYIFSNGGNIGTTWNLSTELNPVIDLSITPGSVLGVDKLFETLCISSDGKVIAGLSNSYQGHVYKYLLTIYEDSGSGYSLTFSVYLGSQVTDSSYTRVSRNSCDISNDGTILAVGMPYNDFIGLFKIYRKSSGSWVEDTVDSVQSSIPGATLTFNNFLNINSTKSINGLGSGVTISDDNLRVYVSDIYDDGDNGAVHLFTYRNNTWEWVQKISASGLDTFNARSLTLSRYNNTDTRDVLFKSGSVVSKSYATISQVYTQSEFTVNARQYTASDLALEVQRRCNNEVAETIGNSIWTVVLNEIDETVTASISPLTDTSDIVTFIINNQTTLGLNELWTSDIAGVYSTSKTSRRLDLSMNNNLLKSITVNQTGVISYDDNTDLTFRRYKPGFSLTDTTEIDIQLRNERDQIIDLFGLDWSFTAFASIKD